MTWAISVPILVFLGHSVLDLGPIYATDRQTDVRRQTKASINAPAYQGRRHNKRKWVVVMMMMIESAILKWAYTDTAKKLQNIIQISAIN